MKSNELKIMKVMNDNGYAFPLSQHISFDIHASVKL